MSKNTLPIFIMHISEGFHYFEEAHYSTSENLTSETGKTYYCGVKGILFLPKNHPDFKLSHHKAILLFFHRIGEPFIIKNPFDPKIVLEERKNQILIERGFYQLVVDKVNSEITEVEINNGKPKYISIAELTEEQKTNIIINPKTEEKMLPFDISDIDFCKADFGNNLLIDEIAEFQKISKSHFHFSKVTSYLILACVTISIFFFFRFDGITALSDLLKVVLK